MKNLLISLLFLSFMAFSITTLVHAQTPKTNNLITVQFQVTSINNGTYNAIPLQPNKDKPALYFNQSDIKGNKSIEIDQVVTAYYKPSKGSEDTFLYVTPTNRIIASYTILETHKDYVVTTNKYYPNLLTNFYYDDMQQKEKIHVNDQIKAYFTKDKHDNYHLLYWKVYKP